MSSTQQVDMELIIVYTGKWIIPGWLKHKFVYVKELINSWTTVASAV